MSTFFAVIFSIAMTWNQLKWLLTDEGIRKVKHIYTMENYSISNKNEIMTLVGKWMNWKSLCWMKQTRHGNTVLNTSRQNLTTLNPKPLNTKSQLSMAYHLHLVTFIFQISLLVPFSEFSKGSPNPYCFLPFLIYYYDYLLIN